MGYSKNNNRPGFLSCQKPCYYSSDIPDISQTSSLASMFFLCGSVRNIPNINTWDVSILQTQQACLHTQALMGT